MLGKLMKYEFKATGRIFLPLFAALVVLAGADRLLSALNFHAAQGIDVFIFVMLAAGLFVVTLVITLQRFRNNLFKDEGYLMFTLPVRTDSLILSKLFVSVIWVAASAVTVLVSALMLSVRTLPAELWDGIQKALNALRPQGFYAALSLAELLLMEVVSLFAGILTLYASMALGLLVNRHRGLLSFGAFVVLGVVQQLILSGAAAVNSALRNVNLSDGPGLPDGLSVYVQIQPAGLMGILFWCAIAAGLYFLTRHLLNRRLNLE